MKKFLLIIVLLNFISCFDSSFPNTADKYLSSSIKTIQLDHYLDSAMGICPVFTHRVKFQQGFNWSDWQYFYNHIDNFDFQWGHCYTLKVLEQPIVNPLQDGPSVKYSLVEIISDERIDINSSFYIKIKKYNEIYIEEDENSEIYLLNGLKKIQCNNDSLAQTLKDMLYNSDTITAEFKYSTNDTLILLSLSDI
jgi:hypothetical protein